MNDRTLFQLAAAATLLGKLFIPFGTRLAVQKTPEPQMEPDAPPQEKIPPRRWNKSKPLRWRPVQPVS